MIATIVFVARFRRPLAICVGSASAFAPRMILAITAGQMLRGT
jgi:putative Ca2+/H+ antiporter (TMEM165/GDT1 family)